MKKRYSLSLLTLIGILLLAAAACQNSLKVPPAATLTPFTSSGQLQPSPRPQTQGAGETGQARTTGTPSQPAATLDPGFVGQHAYEDVKSQVAFGPRIPGSAGHDQVRTWIQSELESAGWQVEVQESEAMGHPVKNIVARRGGQPPEIIIGAHYDSRIYADHDPDPANHTQPVPAANDGGSGVAVLLGLARTAATLRTAVFIMCRNAVESSVEGGVVTVTTREKDGEIVLTVSDNGRGIPGKLLQKIFDPFYGAQNERYGLGWTLVKQIASEHLGRVEMRSERGMGTTCVALFPKRWTGSGAGQ